MTVISLLVVDVVAAVLLAPVVSVIVPRTRRAIGAAVGTAGVWLAASFAFVSTFIDAPLPAAVTAHVVLASAMAAAAAVGAAWRVACRDSLDALAASLASIVVLTGGVFAAGRFTSEIPVALLNAALAANPLVATTAAARVDLFRTDLLYRVSPLPHVLFEYPDWQRSSTVFTALAALAIVLAVWRRRIVAADVHA